jgi:rare lipoprotein A
MARRVFASTYLIAISTGALILAGTSAGLAAEPAATRSAAKPIDRSGKPQKGRASYFGAEQTGKTTAGGSPAKPASTMTAASRTLPLGTTAKVTNRENGKSVDVKVVDRGPYAKHRILDVSAKAAGKLDMKKAGTAPVKVQPLHEPAKAH